MQIPLHFWAEIGATEAVDPKKGAEVYLIRKQIGWPAILVDEKTAQLVRIDPTGRHHIRQRIVDIRPFTVLPARKWQGKWAGPAGDSYVCDVQWDYHGIEDEVRTNARHKYTEHHKDKSTPTNENTNRPAGMERPRRPRNQMEKSLETKSQIRVTARYRSMDATPTQDPLGR